jgi:hypothetical protein
MPRFELERVKLTTGEGWMAWTWTGTGGGGGGGGMDSNECTDSADGVGGGVVSAGDGND